MKKLVLCKTTGTECWIIRWLMQKGTMIGFGGDPQSGIGAEQMRFEAGNDAIGVEQGTDVEQECGLLET